MFQVCPLLALLVLCSCTKVSSTTAWQRVEEQWRNYKNECLDSLNRAPPTAGPVCNRTFDQYACWPDGLLGTTVNVSCPKFLPWYYEVQDGLVYRFCGEDGRWAQKNTSECEHDSSQQQYGRILSQFRIVYTVGYSLSLGALLLALGILISFRKLHCMRNNIHMNLFASFILRAVSILVKDALLTLTLDPRSSGGTRAQTWINIPAIMWCRGAMVMMQYTVMANNYWLLVEGIYLHSLLVITVFSEKKYFYIYLAIGWGAPLVFVSPWIAVKYLFENEECWERNTNMGYWWIIRCPILVSYLINFFIFIRIIKILMSKLRAHQMRYTDYKFRLAKSTLTLIPLLGIHAILFTFVIDEAVPKGSMLRLIRLFVDLLFNSFQGLLVAILYCFVNKEVQSEMLKKWKRWKLGKDIDEEYRNTHSQTPHIKSGSIATGNLPDLHDNNTTDPSGGSLGTPQLRKADNSSSSHAPPDENRQLVVSYSNEMGNVNKQAFHLSFVSQQGDSNYGSTSLKDTCREERIHCHAYLTEGEETDV
ncbi:glucagon receptor isoform X1 [Corythoichthys intestinalis]|uniref:glucagon receptor isoform X1 n=1 Tax=Corythoichthys intestinalis TaxID=161448 RepID=UPI0025A4F3A2|nr:glucagon receptor isoform X1 [Corythoichthys intestinalis]XP_057699721.1 glucagon receptor isoform X1 [Corythoichthys intestinalis]XP_057699722.1 glucagon receptor isoform X1 [Corythoichthys intestinalis]XP_057699723.1 glucagon receptor isoform X1 [Corythoichthys intestinalis]XP_061791784.1 glucagon receptor-like [Nerophis lumbriciformis]